MTNVLYVMVSGSPRTAETPALVGLARERGWDAWVIATPDGLGYLDVAAVEDRSGHPVHSRFRRPGERKILPPPAGVVACPLTFNSIAKLATGVSDTLVVGMLVEAIGLSVPTVVCPSLNSAQAAHWAFPRYVGELRAAGVEVLYGPGVYEAVTPGTIPPPFPLTAPLDALDRRLGR